MSEYAVEERKDGDVEVAFKPKSEIVRYTIDADVQYCGYRRARIWRWWEKGRDLTSQANWQR